MKIEKIFSRVDAQVIIMVTVFSVANALITGSIYWKYTFDIMMREQEERVHSLYNAVELMIDKDTFRYINTPEDMETDLYKQAIDRMLDLKNISGVMYLYTAKINEQGDFVYVVDGLERHLDFRYPNDLIEEEIVEKMKMALEDKQVMPKNILYTNWGYIFMAYMPVHDINGDVLGVVGIEFDATESYNAYLKLKITTVFIAIISAFLACVLSIYIFKQVSNPLYLGKINQDSTTGFKNRNAYDLDLHNLTVRNKCEGIGIIVMDINGLKEVNDRLGHICGDDYIKLVAQAVREHKTSNMVAYRTGGDEFVLFIQHANEQEIKDFIKECCIKVQKQEMYDNMRCSVACGYSIFDEKRDTDLEEAIKRADDNMYKEKRRQKIEQER